MLSASSLVRSCIITPSGCQRALTRTIDGQHTQSIKQLVVLLVPDSTASSCLKGLDVQNHRELEPQSTHSHTAPTGLSHYRDPTHPDSSTPTRKKLRHSTAEFRSSQAHFLYVLVAQRAMQLACTPSSTHPCHWRIEMRRICAPTVRRSTVDDRALEEGVVRAWMGLLFKFVRVKT